MIDMSKVKELATNHSMREIKTGTKPTWICRDGMEGFEIFNEQVITFWLKEGERVYNELPSSKLRFLEEIKNNKETEEKTKGKVSSETSPDLPIIHPAILPNMLTKELMEKWTFEATMLQYQVTAPQFIKKRKGRGGKEYHYVEGWYMKQVMNLATKWHWNTFIDSHEKTDTEVLVFGHIEYKLPDGGKGIQSAIGQADIKFYKDTDKPVCIGDDYKAAMTDCYKKCISQLGVAIDVYRGEYDE